MSLSQNLQNILEETLQSFLAMDISSNLVEQINRISPNLINSTTSSSPYIFATPQSLPQENEENEETRSLPDLIPIEPPVPVPEPEPTYSIREETNRRIETRDPIDDTTRRIRLWSNVLLDYHNQINTYQENMRAVFNITEHLLPTTETRYRNTNSTNNNNNNNTNSTTDTSQLWQSLFQNPSYVLEFDTTNIWNRNRNTNTRQPTNRPTPLQIQTATTLFSYHPQENPLTVTVCPITLEEFREDEILMRINGCGHIFKATALHRWFERNHKCPSCRYDILHSAFSLPSTTSAA